MTHKFLGKEFTTREGCTFKVVEYHNNKKIEIEFLDGFEHSMFVQSCQILSGGIKNPYHPTICGVGYVGVGDNITNIGGRGTSVYRVWTGMIRRCYDERHLITHPTYRGCTVDVKWHNFQNFAEWYNKNTSEFKGLQLDKDLIVRGNKVYSEDLCCLLPPEINMVLSDSKRGRDKSMPVGVSINKKGKYTSSISIDSKNTWIGTFETVQDAVDAYSKARKTYLLGKAEKWKGIICSKSYECLINY